MYGLCLTCYCYIFCDISIYHLTLTSITCQQFLAMKVEANIQAIYVVSERTFLWTCGPSAMITDTDVQ